MNQNMPTMASSAHTHSTYAAGALMNNALGGLNQANAGGMGALMQQALNTSPTIALQKGHQMSRRLVKVIIADPNENIPLDQCILFSGDEKLTDATDQELFFELEIKTMLEKHNEKRVMMIDKKVKDRIELLEPAKVRDLKMVVVTVATL